MPTLYITEPGARIEKEQDRILVTKDDQIIFRSPLRYISDVVLVGNTGTTTPAMHALLREEIPLILVSRTGKLLGRLQPETGKNLPLRQTQYQRNQDQEFSLSFSQKIVAGKIHNQSVFSQRLLRRRPYLKIEQKIKDLKEYKKESLTANSLESLLGIEGHSSRIYYSIYRQVINPEWSFTKRTRRPPKDPFNALLSLGYTFLGHAMTASLQIVGLDPFLGYFHIEKYGRPALSLDMIEEFRTPIVDSLVLDIVNHNLIRNEHFDQTTSRIQLTNQGLKIFFTKFSQKLESQIKPRDLNRPISYRKLFEIQARKLTHFVLNQTESYSPFRWR